MAANIVAFYAITQSDELAVLGAKAIFEKATNLLPVGFAVVLTTVANGLLSTEIKDRLVFLRWLCRVIEPLANTLLPIPGSI
jgi:hypothetical protein